MTTATWKIDPAHTNVEFAVKHMMFTTVRGRFTRMAGTIAVDENNPRNSHVEVEIDPASIDTGVADRDAHLRSADFFDAPKFPKLTFRSTSILGAHAKEGDEFKVIGDLEIRGMSIPVTLTCSFQGIGKDPWGNERAGFSAKTEIDRRHWGLQWNQALETGGILVGNSVKIEIEAQAVRQEVQQAAA